MVKLITMISFILALSVSTLVFGSTAIHQEDPKTFFHQVEDKSHFVKGKDLFLVVDRADIVINFDIQPVKQDLRKICQFADLLQKTSLLALIRNRFADLCRQLWRDWARLRDILGLEDFEDHGRNKRGLISAAASFLLGGVSTAIFGDSYNTRELRNMEDDVNVLHTAVHQEDLRIHLNQRHIQELAHVIEDDERKAAFAKLQDESAMATLATFQLVAWELSRTINGLLTLVGTARLSPALLAPGVLQGEIDHIASKAEKKDLIPLFESETDLLRHTVSYFISRHGTVRIVAHVPLSHTHGQFETWRYIPAPFTLNHSEIMVVPAPNREVLAINPKTKEHFLLDGTEEIKGAHLTKEADSTVVQVGRPSCCLSALMAAEKSALIDRCTIRTSPTSARAWPVADDAYLLFHPHQDRVVVSCAGSPLAVDTFKGLRELRLRPGCSARSGSLRLQATLHERAEVLTLRVGLPGLALGDLNLADDWTPSELLRNLEKNSSATLHLPTESIPRRRRPRSTQPQDSLLSALLIATGFSTLLMSAVLAVCIAKCNSWCKKRHGRRSTSAPPRRRENSPQMEMVPLNRTLDLTTTPPAPALHHPPVMRNPWLEMDLRTPLTSRRPLRPREEFPRRRGMAWLIDVDDEDLGVPSPSAGREPAYATMARGPRHLRSPPPRSPPIEIPSRRGRNEDRAEDLHRLKSSSRSPSPPVGAGTAPDSPLPNFPQTPAGLGRFKPTDVMQ